MPQINDIDSEIINVLESLIVIRSRTTDLLNSIDGNVGDLPKEVCEKVKQVFEATTLDMVASLLLYQKVVRQIGDRPFSEQEDSLHIPDRVVELVKKLNPALGEKISGQ